MKKILRRVSVLFLTAVVCLVSACSDSKKTLTIGTGNSGGKYYYYGKTISEALDKDCENVFTKVRATAGSAANLRLLRDGFLDIAIVQSDMLLDAYNGSGSFEGNACKELRALAGMYIEECQIVVRDDSDINSVNDLYGKKISVGEKESGVTKNAEQILSVNGMNFDMIDESYLSFTDSALALSEGKIDAFFCTAGAPTIAVDELAQKCKIRILSLDSRTVELLTKNYYGYSSCIIKAGTYEWLDKNVETVGVKAVLVAKTSLDAGVAEQILNSYDKHYSEISTSGTEIFDKQFAVASIPVPMHSGAEKWYQDNGIAIQNN